MTDDYSFWHRHFVTLESDAKRTLIPAIKKSDVFTVICPGDEPDVKVAVELGIAIYLNKPILVLRPPNRFPSLRLTRVMDKMIDVPENASLWPELIEAAVDDLLGGSQ